MITDISKHELQIPHKSMVESSNFSNFWQLQNTWWRPQMETFSALLAICAGISPVPGEFPAQRPVTRSFYVFFDLRLYKRLSKQSWGWWFETLSRPFWRQCNEQFVSSPELGHLRFRKRIVACSAPSYGLNLFSEPSFGMQAFCQENTFKIAFKMSKIVSKLLYVKP